MIKNLLMKRLLLVLMMCLPCWAANIFTTDANCVGAWTFEDSESPDWMADRTANGNNLANNLTEQNKVTYKEGAASLYGNTYLRYQKITDASLSANFPGKNGTGNNVFSFCCWVYPTDELRDYNFLASKWHATNAVKSYNVGINANGANDNVGLWIGYNGGASEEQIYHTGVVIASSKWYHVGVTYDGSTRAYRIRVWDDTGSSVTESTGTGAQTMNIEDEEFRLDNLGSSSWGLVGYLDECVMFNDVLTSDEIDEIRNGTYGEAASTGTSNWWYRRRHN